MPGRPETPGSVSDSTTVCRPVRVLPVTTAVGRQASAAVSWQAQSRNAVECRGTACVGARTAPCCFQALEAAAWRAGKARATMVVVIANGSETVRRPGTGSVGRESLIHGSYREAACAGHSAGTSARRRWSPDEPRRLGRRRASRRRATSDRLAPQTEALIPPVDRLLREPGWAFLQGARRGGSGLGVNQIDSRILACDPLAFTAIQGRPGADLERRERKAGNVRSLPPASLSGVPERAESQAVPPRRPLARHDRRTEETTSDRDGPERISRPVVGPSPNV